MDDFEIEYAERYPGIVKLWLNAWERFIPFLAYPPVIAKIVYTTDLVVILSRPGGVWDVAEKGIQDPGALPRRRLRPQAGTPDRPGPHHYQGRCDRDGYSRLERSSKHLRDLLPRSAQYLLTPNQQERKAIPLLHRRSDRRPPLGTSVPIPAGRASATIERGCCPRPTPVGSCANSGTARPPTLGRRTWSSRPSWPRPATATPAPPCATSSQAPRPSPRSTSCST